MTNSEQKLAEIHLKQIIICDTIFTAFVDFMNKINGVGYVQYNKFLENLEKESEDELKKKVKVLSDQIVESLAVHLRLKDELFSITKDDDKKSLIIN